MITQADALSSSPSSSSSSSMTPYSIAICAFALSAVIDAASSPLLVISQAFFFSKIKVDGVSQFLIFAPLALFEPSAFNSSHRSLTCRSLIISGRCGVIGRAGQNLNNHNFAIAARISPSRSSYLQYGAIGLCCRQNYHLLRLLCLVRRHRSEGGRRGREG